MKALLLFLLIFLGLSICSHSFGQSLTYPKWLQGAYYNSYEDDTRKLEILIISQDKILVGYGLGGIKRKQQENLFKKFKNHKVIEEIIDSTMRIDFIQGVDTTQYEFRLQKVYYTLSPVLTYSIKENGLIKREHSTSCNLVLVKQE